MSGSRRIRVNAGGKRRLFQRCWLEFSLIGSALAQGPRTNWSWKLQFPQKSWPLTIGLLPQSQAVALLCDQFVDLYLQTPSYLLPTMVLCNPGFLTTLLALLMQSAGSGSLWFQGLLWSLVSKDWCQPSSCQAARVWVIAFPWQTAFQMQIV